jgi:hypothetical protein
MASELLLYSSDPGQSWRVRVAAFYTNAFFYTSLGVAVTVHHWEEKHFLFWRSFDWVERPADEIRLSTAYGERISGRFSQGHQSTEYNVSYSRLMAWSAGFSISWTNDKPLNPDPLNMNPSPGGSPLKLSVDAVKGTARVTVAGETLSGSVELP